MTTDSDFLLFDGPGPTITNEQVAELLDEEAGSLKPEPRAE